MAVSAQTVDKALFREDLRYIVETVSEVHPAFVEQGRREALADRAAALLRALPDEVPRWRVGVTVAELLREADDGHTQADVAFGSSRYLPLQFVWLSDGLVVAPVTGRGNVAGIPVASEVLKFGELDTATLENRLSQLISGNRHWVREVGSINLATEGILRWLGAVRDNVVTLTIRTPSGDVRTLEVPLSDFKMVTSQEMQKRLLEARGLALEWTVNGDLFAYEVNTESNYGVFWLRSCDDTNEYRLYAKRFFQTVIAEEIDNVIVSVQQNGGGNSGVMLPLLENIDSRKRPIRDFSSFVRYSRQVKAFTELNEYLLSQGIHDAPLRNGLRFFDSNHLPVMQVVTPFRGNAYILTDAGSYSSATDVAVIFSDNGLAQTVGEPSGGEPTSHGQIVFSKTSGLSLDFSVSSVYWQRPDPSRDPADTLTPDIPLPVTVKDVQTGHSPVLAWLESLANLKP